MTIQAQFLTKKWEVSPDKVMPIEDLSYKSGVKTETAETSGGKDKIISKGFDADTLSVSYRAYKIAGANPEKEYSDVMLLTGTTGPFLIGGKRFGASKWMLMSVKPSDIQYADSGEMLSMKISLEFAEPNVATKSNAKNIGKKASKIEKSKTEKGIKK